MSELPRLDATDIRSDALAAAFATHGACRLRVDGPLATRCAALRQAMAAFFALPAGDKQALDIARSPHFRGYSVMHNERDFREQMHFGCERRAAGTEPPCLRLEGPNLWPTDPALRASALEHLAAVEQLGAALLAHLAAAMELAPDAFALGPAPYTLMKWICYHAQPTSAPRPGVAAHVDFSWLTLTLQDDTGGLELRQPTGAWHAATPRPDELLVHVGELLQFATGNRLLATPHRVVNPSRERMRLSAPVFVAPDLRQVVRRALPLRAPDALRSDHDHVHRVLDPLALPSEFQFGAAEWRRKGENRWCARCTGE